MGWYKFMAERHDEFFSSGIDSPGASRKYYDIPLRRPDGSTAKTAYASKRFMSFGVKLTLAFFGMWLLAYISAAFPYLGTSSYAGRNPDRSVAYSERIGLGSMLLFKGQTAFINYDLTAKKGPYSQLFVDIAPWPGYKDTPHRLRLNGSRKGTLSYNVPETGVYSFRIRISPGARGEDFSYSATWGAK